MGHSSSKDDGVVERGGTEAFDITFYNRDPSLGGEPTNPDGYDPGTGSTYNDPSGYVSVAIKVYNKSSGTLTDPAASGYTPPTTSNLRYSGSTGKFLVDVAAPADATLSTGLGTNEEWAIVWTTTINNQTLTGTDTSETFDVVASGSVSHGSTRYATVEDVTAFMTANQMEIDVNSPYTKTLVESYIDAAMDEADDIMNRTWRLKTAKNEQQRIQWNISTTHWLTGYYGATRIRKWPIKNVTKIELLRSPTEYEDITADEGRKGKWFADYDRGIIYIRRIAWPVFQPNQIRITYTYGEDSQDLPGYVKMAVVMKAAWYILQSDDYSVIMPEGGDSIRNAEKSMNWLQQFKELLTPYRRGLVWK